MAYSANLQRFVEFGKKILAVGRNYSEHIKELGNATPGEPVIFLKPSTAYLSEGQPIKLPPSAKELHHEVELGVVIGKGGRHIPESAAMTHIGGYVLALDMTDRDKQASLKTKGLPWALAKAFDCSCPVSSFIPAEQVQDPHSLNLWLRVNGELRQNGSTQDMIYRIPYLISFLSAYFTLEPGDLILTGTPSGVGPVRHGDTVTAGLEGHVQMEFKVQSDV